MNASKLVYIAFYSLLAAKFGKYVIYHAMFTLVEIFQFCPDLAYLSVVYMINYSRPVFAMLRLSAADLSSAKTFVSANS